MRAGGWEDNARTGAIAAAVVLPLMELGRSWAFETTSDSLVVTLATLVFLPVHVRHVWFALAGRAAPHGLETLGVMTLAMVAASVAVGATWAFNLSSLAVSAFLVLRWRWAVPAAVGAVVWATLLGTVDAGASSIFGTDGLYLAISVVFRAVIVLVIIALVGVVRDLRETQAALAEEAVARQRSEAQADLGRQVAVGIDTLARLAAHAIDDVRRGGPGAATAELGVVSRDLLQETREVLARYRGAADRRQLAAAGAILRSGEVAAPAAEVADDVAPAPLGEVVATGYRTRVLLVVLHVPMVVFLILNSAVGFDEIARTSPWMAPVSVAVGALSLVVCLRIADGAPTLPTVLALVGIVVLTAIGVVVVGIGYLGGFWFIAAAVALLLRGWPAVAGFVVVVVAGEVVPNTRDYVTFVDVPQQVAWYVVYIASIATLASAAIYATVRLIQAATRLEADRSRLASSAAERERRRFSRDLHDALGQGLSAVSLKADLAGALLERDPAAATRELEAVADVVARLADDIGQVTADVRPVSFEVEAAGAVDLLLAAGVDATVDVDLGELSPEANALFGWAVREGATNVLRHSTADTFVVSAIREHGRFGLELVNDGVRVSTSGMTGTGLAGLADRAGLLRGVVTSTVDGDRFRLRILLPQEPGGERR